MSMLKRKIAAGALFLASFTPLSMQPAHAVATYSFTNAAATGYQGPTQVQVNTAYTGTSLAGAVTVSTQGIQKWTVPSSGTYNFIVVGAAGAASTSNTGKRGGKGAYVTASKALTAGQVLTIVIGQAGTGTAANGGGGGASYVSLDTSTSTNLIVAGGGGGTRAGATVSGGDADTSTTGSGRSPGSGYGSGTTTVFYSNTIANSFYTNVSPPSGTTTDAIALLGYGGLSANTGYGDGGGGWLGDGYEDGSGSTTVARKLSGTALGGYNSGSDYGGFGGGGSGAGASGGGGGGGFTGGNGGWIAGGGGTYVNGFNSPVVTLDSRSYIVGGSAVHGYVTITMANTPSVIGFGATSYTGTYRQNTTITATISTPATGGDGKVTFYAGGKKIPGCQSIQSVSGTATCVMKPSVRTTQLITATWTPSDSQYLPSSAGPVQLRVSARSGTR